MSFDGRQETVAAAVGRRLAALGVETVFGVVGSGNLVATEALQRGGARFFAARHETGALCMADGWARVTGRVGVCSVHQGPGPHERRDRPRRGGQGRTPVLVIAGDTPGAALTSNFRIDQHDLADLGRRDRRDGLQRRDRRGRRRARVPPRRARAPARRAEPADRPAGAARRRRARAAGAARAGHAGARARRRSPPSPTCCRAPQRPVDHRRPRRRPRRRRARARRPRRARRRAAGQQRDGPGHLRTAIRGRCASRAGSPRRSPPSCCRRPTSSSRSARRSTTGPRATASSSARRRASSRSTSSRARSARTAGSTSPSSATPARWPRRWRPSSPPAGTARPATAPTRWARSSPPAAGATSPTSRRRADGYVDPRDFSIALADLLPSRKTVAIDSGHFMGWPAMFLDVEDARALGLHERLPGGRARPGRRDRRGGRRAGPDHRRGARRRRAVLRAAGARHRRARRREAAHRRLRRRRLRRRGPPLRPHGPRDRHRPLPGRRPRRPRRGRTASRRSPSATSTTSRPSPTGCAAAPGRCSSTRRSIPTSAPTGCRKRSAPADHHDRGAACRPRRPAPPPHCSHALADGSVKVVDLTQPLSEDTPVIALPEPFANTPQLSRRRLSRYDDAGPAWAWDVLEIGEHTGTHFDAPIHWISGKDGKDVASVEPGRLVGPGGRHRQVGRVRRGPRLPAHRRRPRGVGGPSTARSSPARGSCSAPAGTRAPRTPRRS